MLITKPATAGEHLPTVLYYNHMSTWCAKRTAILFTISYCSPVIDGEWVKASGTTLGADDGIGMVAQLALLASDMQHGL